MVQWLDSLASLLDAFDTACLAAVSKHCWQGSRNIPPKNAGASALGYLIHFVRRAHKMVEAAGIDIRP